MYVDVPAQVQSKVEMIKPLIPRLQKVIAQSEDLLTCKDSKLISKALVAIGLTKQAQSEVGAACQNMGFGLEVMAHLATSTDAHAVREVEEQLPTAFNGVVALVSKKLGLDEGSVAASLLAFVDEIYVVAEYAIRRAEEQVAVTV
ncbi:MAG: hypothetical protein C0507_06990 [Cyanobacteria bacterium PR.3.49]|jgi:hypothetical protein|nr:hypothetical protein [Cyanobacteria bacterium PR.3.49]